MASTIDYPNELSTVLFVGKCNWNCGFCYNTNLVAEKDIDFDKDILPKMLKRKKFINKVVVSGGEISCYYNKAIALIDKLNENGFTVGIHSNGSNLEFLKDVINNHNVKFVGMDIKTSFNKYDHIIQCHTDTDIIKQSMDFLINSGIEYEFRTTVYPLYVNKEDCIKIAKYLKEHKATHYVIQQFDNSHIDTPINPYLKGDLETVVDECNKYLKTNLRGY